MTRLERIKEMEGVDLAQFLCNEFGVECNNCPASEYCYFGHNGMMEWLLEECDDN